MVYNISYSRPSFVSTSSSYLSEDEKQRYIETSVRECASCPISHGIPEALSFDRIVNGGTCPPCSLRDFMNYLRYIERSAENLQFFLWYQAYCKRFEALPASEKALAPEWTIQAESEFQARQMKVGADTAIALKGTGLESTARVTETEKKNATGSRTPSTETFDRPAQNGAPSMITTSDGNYSTDMDSATQYSNTTVNLKKKAQGAYEDAGLKWQPFTIQPYRDELTRIVAIYVADGGSRQLNLSSLERNSLLHALENTTHPSAFRSVITSVEWTLRCQAHSNFIRWTICNGNRPRVVFARGLGVFGIVAGIIVGILITLSGAGRAWRIFTLLLFFIGISTLIAAWKGMCVVLHGMHHRHLRPWELFQDEDDNTIETKDASFDSWESADSSNSFEDEPWIAKYEKRNIVRKIFDRELWVEEPALRQIQDTIFLQAVLGGLVGGGILMAIFVAVPTGHFY